MTRIEKVIRKIDELRDFYKKTKSLRDRIKEKRQRSSVTEKKERKDAETLRDS